MTPIQSSQHALEAAAGLMPSGETYHRQVRTRRRRGRAWTLIFKAAMLCGIIALCALLFNIVNQSFGYVAIVNEIDPAELALDGVPLNKLPKEDLVRILEANISSGLMRRYEHDLPFAERSRENVHELILERLSSRRSRQPGGCSTRFSPAVASCKRPTKGFLGPKFTSAAG